MCCLHSEKKTKKQQTIMLILEYITWWKYRNTKTKGKKTTGGILKILAGHCYCRPARTEIFIGRPNPFIKTQMELAMDETPPKDLRLLSKISPMVSSVQSSSWLPQRKGGRKQTAVGLQMDISNKLSPG